MPNLGGVWACWIPAFGPHICPRMGLGQGPHLGWLWSAARHPALLACVHVVGAGPGPPVLPATALGEWLVSPSEVCLNPLLKTSRADPSFSLAHGEGSRIQVYHPAHPRRVMGSTLRPTLQTRTLMVQVALGHQPRLHSRARAELAFSLPTRSLRILS